MSSFEATVRSASLVNRMRGVLSRCEPDRGLIASEGAHIHMIAVVQTRYSFRQVDTVECIGLGVGLECGAHSPIRSFTLSQHIKNEPYVVVYLDVEGKTFNILY